ncbi:MAG: hypothetical protein AB7O52_05585 [Planctomycetota bacterium]
MVEVQSSPAPWTAAKFTLATALGVVVGLVGGVLLVRGDRSEITAADLARALDVRCWRYVIPEGHEGEFLTLEARNDDGARSYGGASGWTAGETVWVTIRSVRSSGHLEWSIVGDEACTNGTMENPFTGLSPTVPAMDHTSLDKSPLLKGNLTGSVSMLDSKPGDVSLWLAWK